jgi:hypothetical protein
VVVNTTTGASGGVSLARAIRSLAARNAFTTAAGGAPPIHRMSSTS